MNSLCIVLPAFNEEVTIAETILDYHTVFPKAHIYVVNNNSTDQTYEIACKVIKDNNILGLVLNESQQGKAFAVRKALHVANFDYYIMADADMTYPALEAKKCFEKLLETNSDMVTGDRISGGDYIQKNKRVFHTFGNLLVKNVINSIFRTKHNDIFSGLRAFNHKLAKNFPVLSPGFELETELTLSCLRYNFSTEEIPIRYEDRPDGSDSKLNTFIDGFKVVLVIFKILKDYKPLLICGYLALFNFFVSIMFAIVPFTQYIETLEVKGVASVVASACFLLAGILSIICGVILEEIEKNHQLLVQQFLNSYDQNRESKTSIQEKKGYLRQIK